MGADFSPLVFKEVEGAIGLLRGVMMGMMTVLFILLGTLVFSLIRSGIIERKLYIDPLTGVYNRNMFYRLLRELPLHEYGLAVLDLDNFKLINDIHGHDTGDEVFRAVAGRIRRVLRNEDYIIRYGGEEFVLFIRKKDADVAKVVDRVLGTVSSSPVSVNGRSIRVTASAGVLLSLSKERNLEEAVKKADLALYEAKRRGKNRAVVYSDGSKISVVPFHRVKEALEEGRIFFFYQPVFDLESMEVVFLEALARMEDETGNLLSPITFLPSIRGTETYRAFTRYVIERNVEALRAHPELRISVNLEVTQLIDEDILRLITEHAPGVKGRFLVEILEYEEYSQEESRKLMDAIGRVRDSGIEVLIDDFGTGYSNLFRLADLSVDYVKIAGDIVKNIHRKSVWSLCKAIVSFCEDVGIKVIAESIEDEDMLMQVREAGIKFGQGFHLLRPGRLEDISL